MLDYMKERVQCTTFWEFQLGYVTLRTATEICAVSGKQAVPEFRKLNWFEKLRFPDLLLNINSNGVIVWDSISIR